MREIDTRVTEWVTCKNGPWYPGLTHGGYTEYRIWQQFDGLRWFQRHEWNRVNGVPELEKWIAGADGWINGSLTVADSSATYRPYGGSSHHA